MYLLIVESIAYIVRPIVCRGDPSYPSYERRWNFKQINSRLCSYSLWACRSTALDCWAWLRVRCIDSLHTNLLTYRDTHWVSDLHLKRTCWNKSSGLWTPLVVGPGLKALDTESGGPEESADHLQLHLCHSWWLPLRTRLGLVGGLQFSQGWLYVGKGNPRSSDCLTNFWDLPVVKGQTQSSWLLKDIAGLCSCGWQDSLRPSLFRGNANGIGNRQIRAQY